MNNILIVEDEEILQRMYQRYLTFQGYKVSVASDGEEGITKATSENPNLIILDIMLPKMNGLEVLQALKSQDQTKKIPIIMLSNLSNNNEIKKIIDLGVTKYLVKSDHEPEEIAQIIDEVLRSTNSYGQDFNN